MKLPAHRAGLRGKVISFHIVPLDPACEAGLAGHVPVKGGINEDQDFLLNGFFIFASLFSCSRTNLDRSLPWLVYGNQGRC